MTNTQSSPHQRTIRSVDITFEIIGVLQRHGRSRVTDLATELEHSKSTIHSHLLTLEKQRIVVREPDGYRLSLRILKMATDVKEQFGNYSVICDEVDTLATRTGEIAQFGIEEHGRVSYLYKSAGEDAVETRSRVGTQQPMYSTSLGKTILAHLPSKRTEEISRSIEYKKHTKNTISGIEELYEELEEIREQGYGIDDEENIEGLRCISAPIMNDETIIGAVSVTGPSSRFTHDRLNEDLSDYVQRAANVIELNTKFS